MCVAQCSRSAAQCPRCAVSYGVTMQTYFKAWSTLIKGSIGGAGKTFACKSQEYLWQDWYIYY